MSSDNGSSLSTGEDQQLAIDQRHHVLQAEQEDTQKRTFSNWINSQLLKHQKRSIVEELCIDIQDGHILLDLLEVLSGEILPREKGRNVFQSRSNIESALSFLGKRSIKLINIHVEDIISGKPSIVLGLIWQIILHFHIEGLASSLEATDDLQPVTCDTKNVVSPTASPSPKRSAKSRWKISAKKALLQWAQERCAPAGSVVTDFKSSWKNGQALLAIIHSLRPDLVDMEKFQMKSNEDKLQEAFKIAEDELKIPRLLEPQDLNVPNPDEKSIMTYVAQFLQYSKNMEKPTTDTSDRVSKAMEWLNLEEKTLKKLFSEMKDETYTKQYQEALLFMRKFNEQKKIRLSDQAMNYLQPEEQRLIKQSVENITFQIAQWKEQLDRGLPPPLDAIENWLSEVENLMSQTLPESESHNNTMSLLQNLSVSLKALMAQAPSHLEHLKSFKNIDDNGVILVPTDKTEEMKTRMEKILTANFSVLVDYRGSGHYVLALLEEGRPKLKAWKGKYKSQESVELLLKDYREFIDDKPFMIHLENTFQKFKEFHNQLLITEEYSDDPEIAKQYEVIELKYKTFLESTQEAKSVLEKVLTCWTQFENNMNLITVWLDEQHKIHPGHAPMEIISKWKSVQKALNRDCKYLVERTNDKMASKLSHRLKNVNSQWSKYLNLYEEQKKTRNGSDAHEEHSNDPRKGGSTKQTDISAQSLRIHVHTLQKGVQTTGSLQACLDILSLIEKMEKSTELVNIWAEGAEQILATSHLQDNIEESVINKMQEFYDNGISHQEHLAEVEKLVQTVHQILLSHEELQHFSVDVLKRNVALTYEKVQELLPRLGFVLHPPEKHLSEKDIKWNFEKSKSDLEHYITSAMSLLGQRITPEEFISQYEKNLKKFSSQELDKFLIAADQMKNISSTAKEKLVVDEVSVDLRSRWKIAHDELESYVNQLKLHIERKTSNNSSCKMANQLSKKIGDVDNQPTKDPKISETVRVHQNGGSTLKGDNTHGLTLDNIMQIFEVQKHDLELILQNCRENLAESPQEAQDIGELQSRLQELQTLENLVNQSWRQLESTSLTAEPLMDVTAKENFTKTRSNLQSEMFSITEEMASRIHSLNVTISVLFPIEQEVSVLCETTLQTPAQVMEKFTISNIGLVYQELQAFHSSVEDQIKKCDSVESDPKVIDLSYPADRPVVQSIVQQYRTQLESTNDTMEERETLLKDLETFFSTLSTAKQSIQAVAAVSGMDRMVILQKQQNLELLEQKVHRLRQTAKELDEYLGLAEIYLEDPEHGGETSCQKLVDGFFSKIETAKQTIVQQLNPLDYGQATVMPALNGSPTTPLQPDGNVPGIKHQPLEEETQRFTESKINSVLQEIKDIHGTFENEIWKCGSMEHSPSDLNLSKYKQELQATAGVMREREATLKVLGDFLSSLKVAEASMEAESIIPGMDRATLQMKRTNLEALKININLLSQEAEKLDGSLQAAEIALEDPEYGGATSCVKLISVFFDKLDCTQQSVEHELQILEEEMVLVALNNRRKDLCKRIEEIQEQVDKIGLQDPTIHAVQRRMKSLTKLEKNLESISNEKKRISDGFLALRKTSQTKHVSEWKACEALWEDVVHCIAHSKEECEVVMKLLREFQRYNTNLTLLIQTAETLISNKSSYMGKENLEKFLIKVQDMKQEFENHSEDVEEQSSICKKLQFQINKIKSFEESPFQVEANKNVDKWLDISEKLDNYNENLRRAICCWSKIQNISENIEHWSKTKKNVIDISDLTSEDALLLNVEIQNQEKHLEEIGKLSTEIQNLLQSDELPFELQVIQTSLQDQISPLIKFASEKAEVVESSPTVTPALNLPAECLTDGKLVNVSLAPLMEVFECVNGVSVTELVDAKSMDVEPVHESALNVREQSPKRVVLEPQSIELHTESLSELSDVEQSDLLGSLHVRLSELKNKKDNLNTDLQLGLQGKIKQLDSFTNLIQENLDLREALKDLKQEIMAFGSSEAPTVWEKQWLELQQRNEIFIQDLQGTVQMLESRVDVHRQYDSLSTALNNKMTSFYEDLLNFSSSSRGNLPCEQKRQKLQLLHDQYEILEKDLAEVSDLSENVKKSTSPNGVTRIQEALDMCHCKMKGFLERLDYLKEAIEQPPITEKHKKKKTKKGTKKKTENSVQPPFEPPLPPPSEKHVLYPKGEVSSQPVKLSAEPSRNISTEGLFKNLAPAPEMNLEEEMTLELTGKSPVQSTESYSIGKLTQYVTMKPANELAVKSNKKPLQQSVVNILFQSSADSSEELKIKSSLQPEVQMLSHLVPKSLPFAAVESSVQTLSESLVQPDVDHSLELPPEPSILPAGEPLVHFTAEPSMAPVGESPLSTALDHSVQLAPEAQVAVLAAEKPLLTTTVLTLVPPVPEVLPDTAETFASPAIGESVVPATMKSSLPASSKPLVKSAENNSAEAVIHNTAEMTGLRLSAGSLLQSVAGPSQLAAMEPVVGLTPHPKVQLPDEPLVQNLVQSEVKHSLNATIELPGQPATETPMEAELGKTEAIETSMQDAVTHVRHVVENVMQNALTHVAQDSVEPELQDDERPIQLELTLSTAETTQLLQVTPKATENVKQKKSSKGRKKKKINVASRAGVEQAINGAISTVQKDTTQGPSKEGLNVERIEKKINLAALELSLRGDGKDSSEVKEESHEAIGQLQMLLRDCDIYRRQLETLLNRLPDGGNGSLRISALLTTVQERLRQAERHADDRGSVLNEVQPLYDEIKTYMGELSHVDVDTAENNGKTLKDHFEDVVEKTTPDVQLISDQISSCSSKDVSNTKPVSFLKESESTSEKILPHQFQKEIQKILSNISYIDGDQTCTKNTMQELESHFKLPCVTDGDNRQSEQSPEELQLTQLKKKISGLKKQPFKLNVTELEREIQDIKKLYNDILQLESQEPIQRETQDGDSSELFSTHEDLLQQLTVLRTEKSKLFQALKKFEDALWDTRRSYQMLCKEKENLKVASTESHKNHLDKIKSFLLKMDEEKHILLVLKEEQANIDHFGLLNEDWDKIVTEVRQIEDLWEQTESSVYREYDRLSKEGEEFAMLKEKVDYVWNLIKTQQDLLDQPSSFAEDVLEASFGASADIETTKHCFHLLKNSCDLQMKRTWGPNERQELENSLDSLQSELESLEERVKDRQLTRCQTPDAFLEKCQFLKPLYESYLWVKKSQDRPSSGQAIALLLKNSEQQITAYKKLCEEISDKQSFVESTIKESKHISKGVDLMVSKDFSSFFQQLQELYQEQIIQSTTRLQQLELGLERRKALFSEIEKLKELLRCLEKEATPVIRGVFPSTELCDQLNCLKAKTKEMEEIEGLVLTLLRNSQSYHGELKNSEQLYLNDVLRSLKSKARRIRRFEEKTFSYTKKLLSICNEFQERMTFLNRHMNVLQSIEPKIDDEVLEQDSGDFENKLQISQDAILFQIHLHQILKYKELFEDNGLYWDNSAIDNLKERFLNLKNVESAGYLERFVENQNHYQELLKKIRLLICSMQKESVSVAFKFDILTAKILLKNVEKLSPLMTEALDLLHSKPDTNNDTLLVEQQSLRTLADNMDQLHQTLSQLINDYCARDKNENFQHQMKQALYNLNRIDRELQEPFNKLDESDAQVRLIRLETLAEICNAELQNLQSVVTLPLADDKGQLNEAEIMGRQVMEKILGCINTTKETCNSLQNLQEASTKVVELFTQFEENLQVDFEIFAEQMESINSKREELDVCISEIHNIFDQLKSTCGVDDHGYLDDIYNQIASKNSVLTRIWERKLSALASYEKSYELFKEHKQKICERLEEIEIAIRDSFLQKPTSYKAALEQWEKSKNLTSKIQSYEEELLTLQQISAQLGTRSYDSVHLADKMVASLWDRWLYLLGISRDWELYCDELKQEWKYINELMEREVILLDNCQEEVLDNPEVKQPTFQLQSTLDDLGRFEENLEMQQLQLSLLKHRINNILGTESGTILVPVISEIQSMEAKCESLLHKAHRNKQEIHVELKRREALKDEISAVKKSIQEVSSTLEKMEITDVAEAKTSFEELLKLISSEKERSKIIMEKLQDRYTETVPADLMLHAEECQEYLHEIKAKVINEIEQCSPYNIMTRKVNEIKAGLQDIESQLTVKSENIFQAKELQKKVWDEVDIWHSKLHALESEVQDMAEDDPNQAQAWMDILTEPFHYHQQVTYLVERRTANLNKAASKLEEYEDSLKSIKLWIQNTNSLLNEEMKDCSAKVLNKHVNALAIALDDSEQKEHLLDTVYAELAELAIIFETDNIVECLGEVRSQVKDLQQRIFNILPRIQHLANEVVSIETEVKRMEKRVDSIKTILTSSEIDGMSPKEHHKHGQVILENIDTMRRTVANIEAYRPILALSAFGVQSLYVFRRMKRLLREAEILEKVIKEQNELLEPIVQEMSELEQEQEQERLKHFSKNSAHETPDIKVRTDKLRKQLDDLNQSKEAILLSQRSSVIQQLTRLQLEPQDQDSEDIFSPVTEGVDFTGNEGNRIEFLPSVVEEAEEPIPTAEAEDKVVSEVTVDIGLKTEDVSDLCSSPVSPEQLSQEQLENVGKTSSDVKPEMILSDCQGKVTKVELWLQTVNLSLTESTWEPEMLQSIEQQLADCQKTLQETEKKINSLLEDADYKEEGHESVLEEAESIARKLKALKASLESVQAMLQVKPDTEQVNGTEITDRKYHTEKPISNQEVVLPSQARHNDGEVLSGQAKPRGKSYLSEDITWSKWQYLQKELSPRTKATSQPEPELEKQTRKSFISRLPGRSKTTPFTEDSAHFLTRLRALSEETTTPLAQESGRNVHSTLFVWLCSVSQWLQKVEEMLDADISQEEATLELAQYEKLSNYLNTLSEEMRKKMDTLLKSLTHEGENIGVLSQCYNDIRNWLIQTHSAASSRAQFIREEIEKHNYYQNDIRRIYDMLIKKKSDCIQHLGNTSDSEASELLKESLAYERELENFDSQVSILCERGENFSIPSNSNQEIDKLEDVLDDTWRFLRAKQEQYSGAAIVKSQIDSLLCGVNNLVSVGKEKIMKSKGYKCRSKEALISHVEDHKKFFSILDGQVLLLQALTSEYSIPAHYKQYAETAVHEADILNQEAQVHCVHLMRIIKEWNEFNASYNSLNKHFEALESLVPTKALVEESEERVDDRLKQYQQVKKLLEENECNLWPTILSGKRLQSVVSCEDLDSRIRRVEQQWSELTKNVNHELHRLESLLSHLASYNKESSELSSWLKSADQQLSSCRMQSLDASQDLDTIRNNLHRFFEFTCLVEEKSSLKTSVLSTGNQLLRLKEADTSMLKVNLAKFEEKWTELISSLPPIHEKLQQLLMEKLPSLQAVQELMDWMEKQSTDLHTLEEVATTALDIRSHLQKYKTLRKEMSVKQWVVDFVNQSLLQLSVGDVESKRYERTEFAECLGSLNLYWSKMQGDLNRKIQQMEQTLESISDQESKRQSVSNCFDGQQVRLNKLQKPSSLTMAESALTECLHLEEQITAKSKFIEEELERSQEEMRDPSIFGLLTSKKLLRKKDVMVNKVSELKTSILSLLRHWKLYTEKCEDVQEMLSKLLYVIDQAKHPASTLNYLKHHLKRLQTTQEAVEQHRENWSEVKDSLNSLKGHCSPKVFTILEKDCVGTQNRWTAANEDLCGHLQSAGVLLQLWEAYTSSYQDNTLQMEQLEGKCHQLLYDKLSEDREADTLQQRIKDLQVLEQGLQGLRAHNLQVSELADKVIRENPAAADVIHSERQNTSHKIDHLERSVSSKAAELKLIQNQVEVFKNDLEKLQTNVKTSADFVGYVCLSQKEKEERSEAIKKHLLELRELSADIERLNEETFALPLDDRTLSSLQKLNRTWEKSAEMALEDCRELRVIELERNNFIQNYEIWIYCLEKMENSLTVGIAGTFETLKKQQKIYERLQAEIAINEHILPSFVNKALSALESEEEERRNEIILKLTSLKEKWQSVIRLVQQRNKEINIFLKQWWQFTGCKQRLEKYLRGVQAALTSASLQKCHSLINAEKLLYDFKEKQRYIKRLQPVYNRTVDSCKDLLAVAEQESKEDLQRDLTELQHLWQNTALQLQDVLAHFNDTALKKERFEHKVQDRRKSLCDLKLRIDEPLPVIHEELQKSKLTIKELEDALDEWGDSLKELDNMKSELSQYIVAEDGAVLRKQVEALHRQWEELCLRVSTRKQEIEDRLNAWNVFNEKNKELCDWLTQMESKVLQTADVNIEEMIEKLQKDCMEEINLFSENKLHLKQIGDQLIDASNKARSTEIENKLNKVNDRWKHLFDVIGSRVKKLKETLVIIQQLDKNMSNLRTWLARIESELSKPVIYNICDDQEINKKLEEQRDLQKDIELHSSGVASVLNICERLLHDTDACASETECDSIQQTTRSLDKRWRNICAMSMERRLRIEETWRLWQKFLDDYSKFDQWLKDAEALAASPYSSDVLYTKAKEEQKKFEAFQRQIHERLTHLELINKQYRRLARENRTDAASRLKQMVHEGNQRWDQLQRRVAAILRRLKHFTSQREDFEGTRDCILVWLTEMDLQLTNVEHFSESDIQEKMQQLIGFKQEITLNTNKIDQLIVFGEQLIQKSEAMDAVVIEDELEEIHRYCQEVFGRVYRFHERLTAKDLNIEEERETSENDTDGEDSREIQNSSWHSAIPEVDPSHQSLCHLMPPLVPHERSGRETPVSVDSIPLEWDPTVDVGGSSMHENEEESTYYNPLTDVEIPENPEAYVIMTTKTVQASSGKSDMATPSWHSPGKHIAALTPDYKDDELVKGLISAAAAGGTPATSLASSSEQMSSSSPSTNKDERTSFAVAEQSEDKGLPVFYRPETHSGVIERWEIIQAQNLSDELRAKQNLQQWQQFRSDLDNIALWLEMTEAELHHAEKLKPSTSIQELEQKVKRLQDILKSFDNYKALVLSANLSGKELRQRDDMESKDLFSRLQEVNARWDKACYKRDKWRESLQDDLSQCEEFHEKNHQLLLWLTEAESRRLKCQVADCRGDTSALLECQRRLTQLEEELREKEMEVNALQDMTGHFLGSTAGSSYIEADERTHVIAAKTTQLLQQVSQDLKRVQQDLDSFDEVDYRRSVAASRQVKVADKPKDTTRIREAQKTQESSKKRSLFYRVLRAALPLQLLLLLLLLLACLIPFSEEDYSCAQANNFARSFYPMLRYTNGPPPT